jgi:hypothetical protein
LARLVGSALLRRSLRSLDRIDNIRNRPGLIHDTRLQGRADTEGFMNTAEIAVHEMQRIASRYAAFAADEARGYSAIYERLALAVAESPALLAFLASLPQERREPNLFLAAVRHCCGVPENADGLLRAARHRAERIRGVMLARTTQTNEPARCGVLLPLLARLPQPLALVEVGASAGLCLIPDRYGYDYGARRIEPAVSGAPVFPCRTSGAVPLPAAVPRVVWRAGLDLAPVDLGSADAVGWLETLVWPDQEGRAGRLRAAIAAARREPPPVLRGDLSTDLDGLLATAPKDATLVVFHSAVLVYVASQRRRDRFAESVRRAGAVWISNEAPGVFPRAAAAAPPPPRAGLFLLMQDGTPLAWTARHGQSIDWFGRKRPRDVWPPNSAS